MWANAGPEIHELAKRLNCPVFTSQQGKGILDERDPLSLGHARSVRDRVAQPHADVMLTIGWRFTEPMTGFRKLIVPKRLIQIDINPGEIGMNYPVEVGIVADAKAALQGILAELPKKVSSDWSSIWPEARAAKRANASATSAATASASRLEAAADFLEKSPIRWLPLRLATCLSSPVSPRCRTPVSCPRSPQRLSL